MRKGDLSINIIIVAAIALLILVIISVLIFRQSGELNEGSKSCEYVGGECAYESDCSDLDEDVFWIPNPGRTCEADASLYCCMKT